VIEDPYTMEVRLCDDQGLVTDTPVEPGSPGTTLDPELTYLKLHNNLRAHNTNPDTRKPTEHAGWVCTGHAHLAGQHIRCTGPAHKPGGALTPQTNVVPLFTPDDEWFRGATTESVLSLLIYSRRRNFSIQAGTDPDLGPVEYFQIVRVATGEEVERVHVHENGALIQSYPCRVCGFAGACGDPPGEDCHS
jgi:hypothetical protein